MQYRDAQGVFHAAYRTGIFQYRWRVPCTGEAFKRLDEGVCRGHAPTCVECVLGYAMKGDVVQENLFWLKITRWLVCGSVAVVLICAAAGLKYCGEKNQAQLDCVKSGRSPAECKEGF